MLFSLGDHDLPCISFLTFSTSVTRPTLSPFVSPSNIFSRCYPLMRFPSNAVVTRCTSLSLIIIWPKKVAWRLRILFLSDLVYASRNTVSFDFFAVHEIRSILQMNHISFASSFVCKCFKSVQHCIHSSEWVQYSTPLLVLIEMCLFSMPYS